MTVSPKHSLDGLRTTIPRSHGVDGELLPPLLFSLPNLKPPAPGRAPTAGVESAKANVVSPTPPLAASSFVLDTAAHASFETLVAPHETPSPTTSALAPTSTERIDPAHRVARESSAQTPRPFRNRNWAEQLGSHSIVLVMLVIVLGIAFLAIRQRNGGTLASPKISPESSNATSNATSTGSSHQAGATRSPEHPTLARSRGEMMGPDFQVTAPNRSADAASQTLPLEAIAPSPEDFTTDSSLTGPPNPAGHLVSEPAGYRPLTPPHNEPSASNEFSSFAAGTATASSSSGFPPVPSGSAGATQTPQPHPSPLSEADVLQSQYRLSTTPRQIDDWRRYLPGEDSHVRPVSATTSQAAP